MDFFQHQDDARRRSRLLIIYFILALIGIVAANYAVVSLAGGVVSSRVEGMNSPALWNPERLGLVSLGTLVLITLASGYKTMQLAGGGAAVAEDLGGRPVDPSTTDLDERRLLNVVEEMAIAAGSPVPAVYVLEDESINAFAAGKTPGDAVIGVTRGCIRLLTRDELQGVIAHEFSHILNGDMRLNLRMVGLLFGILALAIIGQMFIRVAWHGRYHQRRGGNNEGVDIGTILGLVGVGLYIVGYIGVFFGHLIKGAVSRQREFLADSSAVQFTRNPDGIGGALKKIGGLSHGSTLSSAKAEEASHMFFANGLQKGFASLFASHPPLKERISRIDPSWDGQLPEVSLHPVSRGWEGRDERDSKREERGQSKRGRGRDRSNRAAALSSQLDGGTSSPPDLANAVISSFEGPSHGETEMAHQMHEEFPEDWISDVHHPAAAQALVFALLICQDNGTREAELRSLRSSVDVPIYDEAIRLARGFLGLHSSRKLALIDIAIPTLRRLSPDEYQRFAKIVETLVRSDGRVDLFEFALQKVLLRHLDRAFNLTRPPRIKYSSIERLAKDASVLISTMAGLGADDESERNTAFSRAAEVMAKAGSKIGFLPADQCGLDKIERAIDRFNLSAPQAKRVLLEALAQAAASDGILDSRESELLRAVADTIGVPLPPFEARIESGKG